MSGISQRSRPSVTRWRSWVLPVALAATLVGGSLLASAGASGQASLPRIVYTISGATWDDGGTLTGSFIFDPNVACKPSNCPSYSGVNLTTSGGEGVWKDTTVRYSDDNLDERSRWPFFRLSCCFRGSWGDGSAG
jgi:hypothetical protein